MRVGGKRVKPLTIELLCNVAERAKPTPIQCQRRGVYTVQIIKRISFTFLLSGIEINDR